MIRTPSYRLGAEELIELGNPRKRPVRMGDRRPYFADRQRKMLANARRPAALGQLEFLAQIGSYLADGLSFLFNILGDFIDIPLGILSKGIDLIFIDGLGGLLGEIPILGGVLSQIVVLGGTLVKFGLSIPGLLLHGLGNVMGNISEALKATYSTEENDKNIEGAKEDIVKKAPDNLKDPVKQLLDAGGVTGSDMVPDVPETAEEEDEARRTGEQIATGAKNGVPGETTDLEKALMIGAPIAGAAALIAILA